METSIGSDMVVRIIIILSLFATAVSAQGIKPKQSENAPGAYHLWASDSTGRYQHTIINDVVRADTLQGRDSEDQNDMHITIGDTTYVFEFEVLGNVAETDDNQRLSYNVALDRIMLVDGGLIDLPHRDSINTHRAIINALTDSINNHRADIEAHYSALTADIATNANDISANETAINAHIAADLDIDPTNEIQDLSGIRDSIAANLDSIISNANQIDVLQDSSSSYDIRINQNATDIAAIDINDADNDPTNELYDDSELRDSIAYHRIDIDANTTAINAIDTDDADSDPTNELITVNQVNDTTLNILNTSEGAITVIYELQRDTLDVLQLGDGDDQQISYDVVSDRVTLEDGGVFDLPHRDSIAAHRIVINQNASDIAANQSDIAQNAADIAAIDINDADNDPTNEYQSISRAGNIISISDDASTVDLSPYLDDTNLSQEDVQDFVGSMVQGNTETRIAVTYDDAANEFDFVVDDMTYDDSELRDSIGEHRIDIDDIYSQIDGFDFSDDDSDSTNELSTYHARQLVGDELIVKVENISGYDVSGSLVTLSTLNNYLDADSAEMHQILIDSINNVTGIFYADGIGYRTDERIGFGVPPVSGIDLYVDSMYTNDFYTQQVRFPYGGSVSESVLNFGGIFDIFSIGGSDALGFLANKQMAIIVNGATAMEINNTGLIKYPSYSAGMLTSDASGNISSTALPPTFAEMRAEIVDSIESRQVAPIGQILTEDADITAKTYSMLPAASQHIGRQPSEMNCYGNVAASSSVQVTIRLYDDSQVQRGSVNATLSTDITHVDISSLPVVDEYDYFQFSNLAPTGTVDYMTCNIEFE